jgi:hypothetical protein
MQVKQTRQNSSGVKRCKKKPWSVSAQMCFKKEHHIQSKASSFSSKKLYNGVTGLRCRKGLVGGRSNLQQGPPKGPLQWMTRCTSLSRQLRSSPYSEADQWVQKLIIKKDSVVIRPTPSTLLLPKTSMRLCMSRHNACKRQEKAVGYIVQRIEIPHGKKTFDTMI